MSSLIEIGPPKILRFQSKQPNYAQKSSRNQQTNNVEEIPEFLSDFFQKDIKDHLLGGLKCEFCESKTLPWPTLTNNSYDKVNLKKIIYFKKLS